MSHSLKVLSDSGLSIEVTKRLVIMMNGAILNLKDVLAEPFDEHSLLSLKVIVKFLRLRCQMFHIVSLHSLEVKVSPWLRE